MNTKVDEGKLISGKEALIALANGEDVETKKKDEITWSSIGFFAVNIFKDEKWEFRLKPRTISINGVEVPAPFEPKEDGIFYILDDGCSSGYRTYAYEVDGDATNLFFGLWRTEEEIKQVVAALRQVFGGSHDN